MEEIWKQFDEFHWVSNLGRIKKITEGKPAKILATSVLADNCNHVSLSYYGSKKVVSTRVDILVAKAFVPNPNNFRYRRHINGNKLDDKASNLEWMEYIEHSDSKTSTLNDIKDKNKEIINLFKNGRTITNVCQELNTYPGTLRKVCENIVAKREKINDRNLRFRHH